MSNEVAVKKSGKKKTVQLSGIPAGKTAICTVGKLGHDLRYRGYDINDLAEFGTFEEVAYLLIHGELPIYNELHRYKLTLKNLRGLPAPVKAILEQIPAAAHPMDVLRTGAPCWVLFCLNGMTILRKAPATSPTVCWPFSPPC